eukprot:1418361-Alexandrium_andersonii.AAC.1
MSAAPLSGAGSDQFSSMRHWLAWDRTSPWPLTGRPATAAWLATASMSSSEAELCVSATAPRRGVEAG